MHIDYAKELLEYNIIQAKKWDWKIDPVLMTVQKFVTEHEFHALCEIHGSEKTKDIIKTIKERKQEKYFKITDKMTYSVAFDILNKLTIEDIISCFDKRKI